MTPEIATPAPTPTPEAAPAVVSATVDAATKGDFAAFHEATAAERRGTPKPAVSVAPAAVTVTADADPAVSGTPAVTPALVPPTPEARALSKRQQEANDRIRAAVERATEDLRAENARLRAGQPHSQPPTPLAAPAPPEPAWKRYAAMPDSPKLADFDSVEDHAAAMALFVDDTRHAERTAEANARMEGDSIATVEQERISAFDARAMAFQADQPELIAKIAPIAQSLAQQGGPYGVIANLALDSDVGPLILAHFADHPEALQALVTLPESLRALPIRVAAQRHIQQIFKAFGRLETELTPSSAPAALTPAAASPISAAPPPVPTISRAGSTGDPKAAALAKGDFATFSALERADRAAKRRAV